MTRLPNFSKTAPRVMLLGSALTFHNCDNRNRVRALQYYRRGGYAEVQDFDGTWSHCEFGAFDRNDAVLGEFALPHSQTRSHKLTPSSKPTSLQRMLSSLNSLQETSRKILTSTARRTLITTFSRNCSSHRFKS
ncbi:hypothetical protein MJO28_003873 [Puccinia striiformis f. sp. tritici]|uniref:Uncharacterized protein n=1 Tax=Puccinia striiformis f. sp. tritici TaxID=168172 RepID=A0ACC0EMA4_9BASI|nr:hypothetical protein MJO28_003873 [Puccinia striiformis f. sp. tritici]